ncbi:MAG: undecaprenyl phosphate translocase family protein, partial [Eubacterium ramulus]
IKEAIGGFCMALADSVPGVSGGTVAFIMGFYDQFIGSVHDLAFGKMEDKKKAIAYLIKLGIGWIIGMGLAVVILSALFESHIYVVSSLFIGFIAGAIPLIIREERDGFKQFGKGILFLILGIVLVAGITWLNSRAGTSSMDLSHFQLGNAIKLFFIGMIAISAMFFTRYFRFHPAFDLRCIHSGDFCDPRSAGAAAFLCTEPDLLWTWYRSRRM